jgi:hypothetical protein
MKNFPYPDKALKTNDQLRGYFEEVIFNTLSWLKLDGYNFYILFPEDDEFFQTDTDAGAAIRLEYPYKKFKVSIQQDTVDKCKSEKLDAPFWLNCEASIFHEIIHIITWRGTELAKQRYVTPTDIDNQDEYTVDHLANVIYPLVKENRKLKK